MKAIKIGDIAEIINFCEGVMQASTHYLYSYNISLTEIRIAGFHLFEDVPACRLISVKKSFLAPRRLHRQ